MPLKFHVTRPGVVPEELKKIIGDYDNTSVNIIGWIIEGGVLRPNELEEAERALQEAVSSLETDKPVVITGRGPLWLYSMVAHNLHFFKEVAVWDPRQRKGVIIEGPTEHLGKGLTIDGNVEEIEMEAKGKLSIRLVKGPEYQIFHSEIQGDRFLHPRVLRTIDERIREVGNKNINRTKPVVIEGPMPAWLASYYTLRLVHKTPALGMYDPRLGAAVITATHHPDYKVGQLLPVDLSILEKKNTVIIGVVGHPNSGKSVFLHLLNDALKKRGVTTLTQEADITAPTQHWSLYAPDVRRELKKHMNPEERLAWIISSLERLKKEGSVDIVLSDIGGGRPDLGQLVTRENAAILQRVDAVVIVTREGEDEWLRQLKTYAPNVKIVAVLRSRLTGTAEFNEKTRSGVVVGLDRRLYTEGGIPVDTRRVAEKVAGLVLKREFMSVDEAINNLSRMKNREQVSA